MVKRFARKLTLAALALYAASAAQAQIVDCERMRAAIESMPHSESDAQGAAQLRVDIERLAARADAIGCNNHQFLFFGSPPPPECDGVRRRLAVMQAQYDSMRVRAGDIGRRQALIAQYAASCDGDIPEDPQETQQGGGSARGGSEAICVRKCDGYYFPLTPAMSSARADQLRDLCAALCPNADTGLYSRPANGEIANAVSAESGDRYADLPNALKYTKKFDATCSCRKPKQGWAEVLGRAEDILTEIQGERPGEGPLTPKQADDRSRPQDPAKVAEQVPAKVKKAKAKPAPAPLSPLDPPDPF